jgi:hypothetical protein
MNRLLRLVRIRLQIRGMRFRIFNSDRLVAGLLDRLLQFRCEGHGRLHALIVHALPRWEEAARKTGRTARPTADLNRSILPRPLCIRLKRRMTL